jgi:4-amino-4-deoxy-L-arabinose transferase-like glycosyltransferase
MHGQASHGHLPTLSFDPAAVARNAGRHVVSRASSVTDVMPWWEWLSLTGILAIAAVIRLLWVLWLPMVPESDYATFLDMATKIAGGEWHPQEYGWVYQGSGYPLFMAPIIALGGGLDALRILNVVAQLGMVLGVWWLGRRLFGQRGGIVAGFFAATLPGMWTYVPVLAAESVTVALLTGLACLLAARPTPLRLLATGVTVSALAFTRPSFLPFILVVMVVTAVLARRQWKVQLAWLTTGIMVIALPLMLLNAVNEGPLVPGGAAGWQTWLVNNEHSNGGWFDAYADDAYPFEGLQGDEEIRAAQSKLGLQFMITNPITAISWAFERLQTNWEYDAMGVNWTWDRAPEAWQDRVPLGVDDLKGITQSMYVMLLVTAGVGAFRHRTRPELLVPIVLPLAYALGILAVAEANSRYHAMFLPLLCVVAGGIFSGSTIPFQKLVTWIEALPTRRQWLIIGATGGAIALTLIAAGNILASGSPWSTIKQSAPPLLVIAIVLLPIVGNIRLAITTNWARWMRVLSAPNWRFGIVPAAIIVLIALPSFAVTAVVKDTLHDIEMVSPTGWERTLITTDGPSAPLPLVLQDAGTSPAMRAVSFPDAAYLQFDAQPETGDTVQLARELPSLTVGESYVFYVQVYVPAADEPPGDRLSITLNGATAWELTPDPGTQGHWEYVRLDWVADNDTLQIAVTREASETTSTALADTPLVRTLHLYPLY